MKQKLKKQDIGFTQIKNAVLNDKNLSWKAKGLFAYIYSKPNGWDFHGDRITKDGKGGRKIVFSGLKELEDNGYLERIRKQNGRMEYKIWYNPVDHKGQEPLSPFGQEPKGSRAKRGNISNKDIKVIKNKSNKELSAKADGSSRRDLRDFILWCKKSTQRHIHIIADYADEKKMAFETKDQWQQFIKRNLRPARSLAPYSDDQIGEAMRKLNEAKKEYLTDWTLETLLKFLDK